MRFEAEIELNGKTATGMRVPPEIVAGLGTSKKPAVKVTINGFTYRSTVATMGGVFLLPVSAEVRAGAGVVAGDVVVVDVELDSEPRVVVVPPDFAAVLERNVEAKRFFDGLSYGNRLRIVLAIDGAKTDETRQRRIAKSVEALHAGRA